MRTYLPVMLLFSSSCGLTPSASATAVVMQMVEVPCADLDEEGTLVEGVDPQGWVALVGVGDTWAEAERVQVVGGDLLIAGPCLSGNVVRLSWW